MKSLCGQTVLVLGAGASGLAAARLAQTVGARVILLDSGSGEALQREAEVLRSEGIDVRLGWLDPSWNAAGDLAVISPGITADGVLGRLASSLSCPVQSELAFGAGYCPWPMLAVTGTNGKTTTVEMLTHALAAGGFCVAAGGNIGMPLSALALSRPALDWLVVEV
ncbi:MAG: UDP-N-acetylmuramoyl-L-alanine--D-glutamate ligase, partial [Lentisphaerae bacterium]|nr:UDP-N-acetylmuramoyl-L-alanine--D-glutamate ligase [Lentisphaerota bacterium]